MKARAAVALLLLVIGVLGLASAGAAGTFRMPLSAPTGGGGVSGDGHFVVVGSVGQPIAGGAAAAGLRSDVGVFVAGQPLVQLVLPNVARDP